MVESTHTDKGVRFFAVTLELLQIDESRPAVNFKAVVFPNEWQRDTRDSAEKDSPRAEAYRAFFQVLIDELREKHHFTNARIAQPQNWYTFTSGVAGITYAASFSQRSRVRAEIYIDTGDAERNKQVFDCLKDQKESLEREFGEQLSWERLDDKQASRVAIYCPGSIESNPVELAKIRTWIIDRLQKFKSVFGPKMREVLDSLPTP